MSSAYMFRDINQHY